MYSPRIPQTPPLTRRVKPMPYSRCLNSVLVRPFREGDGETLFEAARESIESLAYWFPTKFHLAYSLSEAQQWVDESIERWKAGTDYRFGVFDELTGQALGCVGINNINRGYNFGNLGYWIRSRARNRGVASNAVALAARIGFAELRFSRLEIFALPANLASIRVAEKVGATREGVARNRLTWENEPANAVAFSLIPGDLRGSSRRPGNGTA